MFGVGVVEGGDDLVDEGQRRHPPESCDVDEILRGAGPLASDRPQLIDGAKVLGVDRCPSGRPRSPVDERLSHPSLVCGPFGASGPQFVGRRHDRCRAELEQLDEWAHPPRVAAAPLGAGEHELVSGTGGGDVQQASLLRCGGDRRRAAVRHEARLRSGDDDRRPLATLGGVEREQLDAALAVVAEWICGDEPRAKRRSVSLRLLTEEVDDRHGQHSLRLGGG